MSQNPEKADMFVFQIVPFCATMSLQWCEVREDKVLLTLLNEEPFSSTIISYLDAMEKRTRDRQIVDKTIVLNNCD